MKTRNMIAKASFKFQISKIIVAGICVLFFSCGTKKQEGSQQGTISGKLDNAKNITVTLELVRDNDDLPLDSVQTDADGNFSLPNKADHLDYYLLRTGPQQLLYLVLKGGETITIKGDANDILNTGEVRGSEENDLVREINNFEKQVRDSLNYVYSRVRDTNRVAADSLFKSVWNPHYFASTRAFAKDFIARHPNSVISLTATKFLDKQKDFETYLALDSSLGAAYPDFKYVQQYHLVVNNMKRLPAGTTAPELNLPSPEGKMIALSSLKGKIVLVDFWASWCGPCRKLNPELTQIYKTFHDRGFEIYGVSLDDDKANWQQAIAMDHLNWVHVSDLKRWESEAAKKYFIEDIPNNVLLNRQGKIIAKGLSGNELARAIDQAL